MSTSVSPEIHQGAERFFAIVKSIHEFDRLEVLTVIDTLLSPSRREQCFIGTYRRITANIATLLELQRVKHFQGIVMLARSVFELAVDIRLIDVVQDSCTKMFEFVDVEKLRTAKKAQQFKAAHPGAQVDTTIYDAFIANNASRVDAARRTLWPKPETMSHWSGLNMSGRVELLNPPFGEIYAVHYPHMSWQVHSGLTGVVNLKAETFTVMCGWAFKLAGDSYRETLLAMIEEFKLEKANPNVKAKLEAATFMPFADTPEQVDCLRKLANPD